MKKFFLRFILLSLLCVLCAPMAWGQTTSYVLNESSEKTMSLSLLGAEQEIVYSLSGPGATLTFEAKKSRSSAVGNITVQEYYDGIWHETSYSKNPGTSFEASGNISININTTKIRFYNNYGSYSRTVRNVKITRATTLSVSPTSMNHGTVSLGNNSSKSVTATYNNTTYNQSFSAVSSNSDFVATPANSSVGATGTNNVTVKFTPTKLGSQTATITLSMNGKTATVTATGVGVTNYYFKSVATAVGTGIAQTSFTSSSFSSNTATANVQNTSQTSATKTVYYKATESDPTWFFVGWYTDAACTEANRVSTNKEYSQTLTSNKQSSSAPAVLTLYAKFMQNLTPEFNGTDQTMLVDVPLVEPYTFFNTSASTPALSGDFYYQITNNTPAGDVTGSPEPTKVIDYNPATKTFTAYNAGTANITFGQKAVGYYEAGSRTFAITVNKHTNTLAVKGTSYTKLVEEEIADFVSGVNSDATITTTSTTPQVATYDVANNKIIAHAAGTTTITISQAATYKYEGITKTINVTVNKHTPAFTWNASSAPYACNTTIENVLTLTNGDPARITYVSDNEAIAEVVDGNLIIHNVIGTANITVTHQATDKWATLSQTFQVKSYRVNNHVPFDITTANYTAFRSDYVGSISWDNGVKIERSINLKDPYYVMHFEGIPDKLSFNFVAADAAINVRWYVEESANGSSWTQIWTSTGLVGRVDLQLNPETRYLRFRYLGTFSGVFSNIHVSELSKLVADVQTIDFGVIEKNAVAPAQSFTISYANAGYQINTSLPAGSPFSVSPALTNSISGEKYGTQVVNVNLNTSSIGQFNHTLEYTDGVHEPVLVNLHAKIVTYFEADIRANYPNARVHSGIDVADAYLFSATSASTPSADSSADFYFELQDNTNSSGQQILSYNPTTNTITTLHEGIARIVFHQKETGLYRAVAREFTIFVSNQDEDVCELKNVPTEKNLNSSSEPYTVSWTEEDAAEAVTFDAKRSLFASHVLVEQYYDGAWHSLSSLSDDQLYSYSTFTRELNRRATAVRFSQNGATDNYVRNVVVTRKNYLETTPSAVYMPRFIVGDASPSTATVEVKWSNSAGQELSVSCSDPNITVSPATISMPDCHNGTATVTLSFAPSTPMNISASLIIGDNYKISVIPVIASATGIPVFEGTDLANPLDWFDDANWSTGSVPSVEDIVIVNAPVYLSNQVVPTVVRGVTIADGGSIIIQPTAGMSIGDRGMTGANSSNLLLEANEDGQTGYLRISPDYHGAMPEASVQMRVSGYASADDANAVWQYLGSPVTAASSKVVTTLLKGAWAYGWDETMASGSTWLFVDPYDNLRQFSGYAITCNQAGGRTYTHTGTINAPETRVINLTYTQANYDSRGFNLLANSWTAPVDATKFRVSDFVNCDATLYMFVSGSWNDFTNADNKMGSSRGQYLSIPVGSAAQMAGLTYKEIPSMQGFFVQANDAGASIKMDYTRLIWNVDYTGKATPTMHAPQRATAAEDLTARLELTVSGNGFADRVYMLETDYYSPEYENGYDARKQIGSDAVPNMFVSSQDGKLTVCATDQIAGSLLGFYAPTSDADTLMSFTLRADNVIGDDLYLYDLQEQTYTLLSEGAEYSFTSQAGVQNDLRFQIVSAQDVPGAGAPTDIEDLASSVSLWNCGNLIFVSGANVADTFRLYNAEGKLLDACAFSSAMSYDASHLTSGVYVAMVGKQVLKIVK